MKISFYRRKHRLYQRKHWLYRRKYRLYRRKLPLYRRNQQAEHLCRNLTKNFVEIWVIWRLFGDIIEISIGG
jgi:hypothetical protein